jgi:hypothetical protein
MDFELGSRASVEWLLPSESEVDSPYLVILNDTDKSVVDERMHFCCEYYSNDRIHKLGSSAHHKVDFSIFRQAEWKLERS